MIGYVRVSTEKQGRSGLGLDAQREAIRALVSANGCDLLKTYTEVETGKRDSLDNRPELRKALAHARSAKATLVIAKLDRLARSVYVTAELHRSGVEFICCDNQNANRLTIQILSAVAEDEARRISERTKAALAAYKRRGGRLGASLKQCRNLTLKARRKGSIAAANVHRQKADEAYEHILGRVLERRKAGLSLQAIADELNGDGYATRREKPWNPMQIKRVLDRFAKA